VQNMKRTLYNPLIIIALVFAFLMVALPIDAATGSKYFKDQWTDGADIYGTQASGLFIVSVTGDVSGQTQFSVSSFKGNYFYKADYFNNIYTVRMIDPSGSITVGSEALITDFDPSSGIFTTGAIGANYAVGDRIAIIWDQLGLGGLGSSGGLTQFGKVSSVSTVTATNSDSIYVQKFIGHPDDIYNGSYLEMTYAGGAAPQKARSLITDFQSATGLIICEPFEADPAAADFVTILHNTVVVDADGARELIYHGDINGNGSGDTIAVANTDTLLFKDLIGYDAKSFVGWFLTCIQADGAAPENDPPSEVVTYDPATGVIIISPVLSAAAAQFDKFLLEPSATNQVLFGTNGKNNATSTFPAAGVSIAESQQWIAEAVRYNLGSDSSNAWQTLIVYVDHVKADSVWSTASATHEVINVPDNVEIEFELTIRDSIALQGADSVIVQIGANKIIGFAKNDWDAGEFLPLGLTSANFIAGAYNIYNTAIVGCGVDGESTGSITFKGRTNGIDIGYLVQTATIVATGYSIWTFRHRKVKGHGAVAAGAGGTL
jgi:hypothetical protein